MASINPGELEERIRRTADVRHSRSGGPGGQNVNKVNSRVTLHVPLLRLGLGEVELARVREHLSNRINGEIELVVHASMTRSQRRNLERAYERARELIMEGLDALQPHRRSSRPSKTARERRLTEKQARSGVKRLRRPPIQE